MSRIKLLLDVVEDMRSLADSIQTVCDACMSDEEPKAKPPTESKKEEPVKQPSITLEEVREVLADKSQSGFTAEVRAIIKKHGADKLSEIAPEHYADVLKEAEVLGDG